MVGKASLILSHVGQGGILTLQSSVAPMMARSLAVSPDAVFERCSIWRVRRTNHRASLQYPHPACCLPHDGKERKLMGASGIELLKRQDALAASVDVPFDVARPATD